MWPFFLEVARVAEYGATKYAERNWERGMSWGHCFSGAMRHLWAWWSGEETDPESGCSHLAHAAWNCMALWEYRRRAIGTDNRCLPEGGDDARP